MLFSGIWNFSLNTNLIKLSFFLHAFLPFFPIVINIYFDEERISTSTTVDSDNS